MALRLALTLLTIPEAAGCGGVVCIALWWSPGSPIGRSIRIFAKLPGMVESYRVAARSLKLLTQKKEFIERLFKRHV